MKVSIAIPAYNEERRIVECVRSVQEQRLPFDHEIIVVNNASTDATAAIAGALGVVVVDEPRKGLANARQAGLTAATGDVLVYVDADTHLPPGWIEAVVAAIEADDGVAGVSCGFRFYDGRPLENLGNVVFQRVVSPTANRILRRLHRPEIVIGSAFAVRTEALRRAGGIDLDFQFYGEDTALAYRLHSQGRVRYLDDLYVLTSARRYQRSGAFVILYRYLASFALIHLGLRRTAVRVAKGFSEQERDTARQAT